MGTKEGYTSQDIMDWWKTGGSEQKIDAPTDTDYKTRHGIRRHRKDQAVVLDSTISSRSVLHNPCGPARVIIGKHTKIILKKEYYLNGKRLDPDDIVYKMIRNREKKHEMVWL